MRGKLTWRLLRVFVVSVWRFWVMARHTQRLRQMTEWLSRCNCRLENSDPNDHRPVHAHPEATISARERWPRRLLDISGEKLRLVNCRETSTKPLYVAISYVWGEGNTDHKTTNENLKVRSETGMELGDLPTTLRDLCELVQALNKSCQSTPPKEIKYVWIDSICIIQDSYDEQQAEIGMMGYIYSNAWLVLSAMAAPGASHGLYHERWAMSDSLKNFCHSVMQNCRNLSQSQWNGSVRELFPLLCRAWVLQERALACRMIHLTAYGLVWECRKVRLCECHRGFDCRSLEGAGTSMSAHIAQSQLHASQRQIQALWRECIQSYSKRQLTCANDRIPAITGIATLLQAALGRRPLSGCNPGLEIQIQLDQYTSKTVVPTFAWDLLWYADQTAALATTKPRPPSWSWCSIDTGVAWPSMRPTNSTASRNFFTDLDVEHQLEIVPHNKRTRCTFLARGELYLTHVSLWSNVLPASLIQSTGATIATTTAQTGWRVRIALREGYHTLPFYPDIAMANHDNECGASDFWFVQIVGVLRKTRKDAEAWVAGLIVRNDESCTCSLTCHYARVGIAMDTSCSLRQDLIAFTRRRQNTRIVLV